MMIDQNAKDAREKMDKSIDHMLKDFSSIRTGRANSSILEGVKVDYYGTETPLTQLCNVHVVEGRTLEIKPYDASSLAAMEKALHGANLGLTPQNDGKLIRVSFPPLTEERRKELAKHIKKLAEDARVSLRNVRRDANEKVKGALKAKEISEDEAKNGEGQVQKLTDAAIKKVDELAAKKEQEILTL